MSDSSTTLRKDRRAPLCPSCGEKGRGVKAITIESLVTDAARAPIDRADGFRFCSEPSCDVAYFHPETGLRFLRRDVRVRIGQKETGPPRPVCYCFDRTIEEIEADVAETGTSKIADEITEKCRQGLDRCEETNPQGSCCLGNVHKALKEARAGREGASASGSPRAGLWAAGGAVVSAILSSACCWLPLLLLTFGASAAGVSGFFEAYRLYLLGATGLLLGGGFYLVYFRRARCGPGESCAVPNPRLIRLNKIMLWVAAVVVLAFTLFPNYLGAILGGSDAVEVGSVEHPGEIREFRIEGMTCEACAAMLRARLEGVSGITRAEVHYPSGTARVLFGKGAPPPSSGEILRAIEDAGYRGSPQDPRGAR